jgi:CheY-like chemotaxis protein
MDVKIPRILIVEDDPFQLQVLKEIIQAQAKSKIDIDFASNGM